MPVPDVPGNPALNGRSRGRPSGDESQQRIGRRHGLMVHDDDRMHYGGGRAMPHEKPTFSGQLGPLELRRKLVPFEPSAASDRLGWVGLEAARYRAAPASDIHLTP